MPASNSFWSRLLSWFRRPAPTPAPVTPPVAPASPPPAVAPAIPAATTGAAGTTGSRDLSPPPAGFVPAGDRPPAGNGTLPPDQTLPTEGPNLGFRRIWNNHPTAATGETFPCRDADGNPNFGNQCAILMGTCLLKSDLLHGYDKSMCWYRGHVGHTLRAREVSDWMRRHPERFGPVEIRSHVTWGAFKGRTGFICFHNFWGEGNQGDHIDLWDGTGVIRRENDPSLEGPGLADGALDYFERSEEVWFWPIH
jgi:hypothetical protein